MKKIFTVIAVSVFLLTSGLAFACDGPECPTIVDTDTTIQVGVWSSPYTVYGNNGSEDRAVTQGFIGYDLDAEARGTHAAYAEVTPGGDGWNGLYAGAGQKEINGGELSYSGALSITEVSASGRAMGVDSPDCNTGADYASVDLEVEAGAYQYNQAYSDDRSNEIFGQNQSQADVWAESDSSDNGSNDQYRRVYQGTRYERYRFSGSRYVGNGWYAKDYYKMIKIADLDANAQDYVGATAITAGGTLVYAKQTATKSEVMGITGNIATGYTCSTEHRNIDVSGNGYIGGVANLPGAGYAGFNSSFSYEGKDFGYGVAGGHSSLEIHQSPGQMSVTGFSSGFAAAGTGDMDLGPR